MKRHDPELFDTSDAFNLRGEPLDESLTPEGERRLAAEREADARKAQIKFGYSMRDGKMFFSSHDL